MPLSDAEKLEIQIEAAWEVFCDSDPERHAKLLKLMDTKFYQLMKLAYAHGFTDGMQSVLRRGL